MPSRRASTLTQEEFARLLGRAAERQVRAGGTGFTLNELIAAGAELDIDAETVRVVYDEHEREKDAAEALLTSQTTRAVSQPTRTVRPVPAGSRLTLSESDGTLRLMMPPGRGAVLGAGVVTIISFGMAAAVAYLRLRWPFVLGLVAIASLVSYVSVRGARTSYELRLNHDGGGALTRFAGGRASAIILQPGQVSARMDEHVAGNQSSIRRTPFLALDHGTHTFELMESFSRAEQSWAVERIQQWLGQR